MRGRIFGIKKSYILTSAFVLLAAAFLALTLLTILLFKQYYLWFFIFCACCGGYQLLKGVLFHFDSAFYFGILLLSVAGTGFYSTFFNGYFQSLYYILDFAIASYLTFVFFGQKFQLYLAILLYFVALFWLFFKIKFISIGIFVALTCASVVIFILYYSLVNWFVGRKRS